MKLAERTSITTRDGFTSGEPRQKVSEVLRLNIKCRDRAGFTVIELLVVITVIVVLLALLTPALDKVIYQAELARCGATQKGIITGATTAAIDYQRRYFDRSGLHSPHMLALANTTDLRPQFMDYLGGLNKILLCAFNKEVDLERSLSTSHAYGNYWTFFGWTYTGPRGGGGMIRLGNGWTWEGRRYGVMVLDYDVIMSNSTHEWATHPDRDGVLAPMAWQDQGVPGVAAYTLSDHDGPMLRTANMDMNVGYADGSVVRWAEVENFNVQSGEIDERMVQVSNIFDSNNLSQMGIVPRR